jgi:hypothetical protein
LFARALRGGADRRNYVVEWVLIHFSQTV